MSVKAKTARPVRTAVQGGAAWVVTEFLDSFAILPMDERQYGAMVAALTILFGWLQVVGENALGKGFLRRVPEPGVPVIDD